MKKKIINGILMAALMLTATTSFVSCKDNVDDELTAVYSNLAAQKTALETKINDLRTELDTRIKANEDNIKKNADAIKKLQDDLAALDNRLKDIEGRMGKAEEDIKKLQADLNALEDDVEAFKNEVNSRLDALESAFGESIQNFSPDWFVNSVFGSSKTPFGVELKGFAAMYGENLTYIENFPTTDASVIVGGEEGDGVKLNAADIAGAQNMAIPSIITMKERNAGKVYFYARANDQSKFDINNYTLRLKDANGREVPVTFTNLAQAGPNTLAWWGTYKIDLNWLNTAGETAEDAWFEADANIAATDLVPNKFQIKEFIDYDNLKKIFNQAWKDIKEKGSYESNSEHFKSIVKAAAKIIINFYSGKMNGTKMSSTNMSYTPLRMYLNRVTEDGNEAIMATSGLDIFATAVTPLSYNAFMEFESKVKVDEDKLKDVGKTITKFGKSVGSEKMAQMVNKFLEKSANFIVKELNNHQLSRAIAPCIFFHGENGEIYRLHDFGEGTTIEGPGVMEIMMTSPTEELLAPAYAKYIAVLKDGKVLQQATLAGGVQYQQLNFPTTGAYTVVFSAVDYHGFVVNKKYQVNVK
jgi:hypothetical protein